MAGEQTVPAVVEEKVQDPAPAEPAVEEKVQDPAPAEPAVEEKVQDPAPAEPAVEDPSAKAAAKPKRAKKPSAPRKPRSATHPPYIEMIGEAITSLKERTGSSQYAIAKFIEEKYKAHLPPHFRKLLLLQLKKLTASGKLNKIKNSYKLPPSRPRTPAKPALTPAKSKPKPKPKSAAATKRNPKPAVAKTKAPVRPKPAAKAAKTKAPVRPKPAAKVAKTKAPVRPKPAAKVAKQKANSRTAKAAKTSAKNSPRKKVVPPAKPMVAPRKGAPKKMKAGRTAATRGRSLPGMQRSRR